MKTPAVNLIQLNDEELLALVQKSNENAYATIFHRYHKMLYVLAYSYLKSSDAAQDAVQHVFLKLWEGRAAFTLRVNLKNYLYTMLKNHVLNEIRNQNTALQKNYELVQSAPEYENELLMRIEEKELMQQFMKAIHRLPGQKKQVCLYKISGKFSNQEIADKMGISVPTVKTHYAQAIKLLRFYFEKMLMAIVSFLFFIR